MNKQFGFGFGAPVRREEARDPVSNLPGTLTRTSWRLPGEMTFKQWAACAEPLAKIEGGVQWWTGDWWAYGEDQSYGERKAFVQSLDWNGPSFRTCHNAGTVARAFESDRRRSLLSFTHHAEVASLPPEKQEHFLDRAENENLSVMKLRTAIRQEAAIMRTSAVEFSAKSLGKFAVILADPPWRYENPPMGGSNRSIENHYPTMSLDEICALPVADIAHEDAVLFLWATAPKLAECMQVATAWGFDYRTEMVWVKDKIGMGYHVRNRHEGLLICKRGELPPPPENARCDSVIEAPRLEHSDKPDIFYEIIDAMYPGLRKIELFSRSTRQGWTAWGNQA
jgi:N6-adenosine-specific RNA methylase IME4